MRCDSHTHIVGPADRFPQVPGRTYLADLAALETLRACSAARGIGRFVIVQPSFYGTDNSATLGALDALESAARGVAVIDPETVSAETLADFNRRGVRGLRINLYSPVGTEPRPLDAGFAAMAKVAHSHDWHVELIAPLPVLLGSAEAITRASVPVVIDHYGLYGGSRPDSAEGRRLMALLGLPHVWIKLTAPYRVSRDPLCTQPDREWLSAILAVAAERCVWGSDWPFTPAHDQHKGAALVAPYRELAYETVLDDFLGALPSAELAERIMTDNPARLYGF